jgi:hypothetical protein
MANTEEEKKTLRRLEKAKTFLKKYTQDDETLNRLLKNKEADDEDRELAIQLSIEMYNTITPITIETISTFPSLLFLLQGATIQILTMKGILQSRNRLNYSSGGLSVNVSDKAGEYQSWINNFLNSYFSIVQNFKKQLNVEKCFGSIPSEYSAIGTWVW